MRISIVATVAIFFANPAAGQTSNTNCQYVLGQLQCQTHTYPSHQPPQSTVDWGGFMRQQQQINQQSQENINRSMQNLGAAIAADKERRRAKKEQEDLARRNAELQMALASDNDPAPPPPEGVAPIQLRCFAASTTNDPGFTLNIYESVNRVDVIAHDGRTRARAATFNENLVSWTGSLFQTSLSRLDLSYVSSAIHPALGGTVVNGKCQLAQKQF